MSYQANRQNTIKWLQQQPDYSINCILTSLPNFRQSSSVDNITTPEQYHEWITNMVLLLFQKIKPEGLVFLFQEDCQINGEWVNHSIFLKGLEQQANINFLWQQTVINSGEKYYSHLYCYSYSDQFQFNNWPATITENSNSAIQLLFDWLIISGYNPIDIIIPLMGNSQMISICDLSGCQIIG